VKFNGTIRVDLEELSVVIPSNIYDKVSISSICPVDNPPETVIPLRNIPYF
jgi:carbonic anhydrase/acetyltransferase-like protein (isoleucine patch superfamily)